MKTDCSLIKGIAMITRYEWLFAFFIVFLSLAIIPSNVTAEVNVFSTIDLLSGDFSQYTSVNCEIEVINKAMVIAIPKNGGSVTFFSHPIWTDFYNTFEFSYQTDVYTKEGLLLDEPFVILNAGGVGPYSPGIENDDSISISDRCKTILNYSDLTAAGFQNTIIKEISSLPVNGRIIALEFRFPAHLPFHKFIINKLNFKGNIDSKVPDNPTKIISAESGKNFLTSLAEDLCVVIAPGIKKECSLELLNPAPALKFEMSTNLSGTIFPFDLKPSETPRDSTADIAAFGVILTTDKQNQTLFPYNQDKKDYIIPGGHGTYFVQSPDRDKIKKITFKSDCSYAVFSIYNIRPAEQIEGVFEQKPPKYSNKDNLSNDSFKPLVLSEKSGLCIGSPLFVRPLDNFPFKIFYDNSTVTSSDMKWQANSIQKSSYKGLIEKDNIYVELNAEIENNDTVCLKLVLSNPTDSAIKLRLAAPVVEDFSFDCPDNELSYLIPGYKSIISTEDAEYSLNWGRKLPMQMIDVYTPDSGVALIVDDTGLDFKNFKLKKAQNKISMQIGINDDRPIVIPPKETFSFSYRLYFHSGSWSSAFAEYCRLKGSAHDDKSEIEAWMKKTFFCRRDYPVGGTGELFDIANNSYTFDKLITDAQRNFGRIDMVDISSWAHSSTFGRVGNYDELELGGLDNLRANVIAAKKKNIRTGLYFEAYLADHRSLTQDNLKNWAIRKSDNSFLTYPNTESEYYMCPFAEGWQDYLINSMLKVAKESAIDAVYFDQYGMPEWRLSCFNKTHSHVPGAWLLEGEYQMITKARRAFKKQNNSLAVYIEQVPVDTLANAVDGAFNVENIRGAFKGSAGVFNLPRFAFPEIKQFDMIAIGINPIDCDPAVVRNAVFNGNGMWLKGYSFSWYGKHTLELIKRAAKMYTQYEDIFSSHSCRPGVETYVCGVYANLFNNGTRTIVTVLNLNPFPVTGRIIKIDDLKSGLHNAESAKDVFGDSTVSIVKNKSGAYLEGTIDPQQLACVFIY